MLRNRIAILTQPLGSNYGGSIQNFALTYFLGNEGYEVETINRIHHNPNSKLKIILSEYKNTLLKYLGNKTILTKIDRKAIFKHHTEFIDTEINLSKPIDNTTDLEKYFLDNQYDIVIVGSDQTWRPSYSPNIYNYYLDFLASNQQIKKIAYASSFGTDLWEYNTEETKICKELAKKFDAISVRENAGVNLCKKHLKVDAIEVLDPTLLLSKEDYLKVIPNANQDRKGVFTYILDENKTKSEIINQVADELEVNIFTNQPKNNHSVNIEDKIYPSVYGWISAFNEADFIVTDSFHGTVFSIIFNKPFITIINSERGASRFYSLLGKFGLENRLIDPNNKKNNAINIVNQPIDYVKVNAILNVLKIKSKDFLLSNLS